MRRSMIFPREIITFQCSVQPLIDCFRAHVRNQTELYTLCRSVEFRHRISEREQVIPRMLPAGLDHRKRTIPMLQHGPIRPAISTRLRPSRLLR